MSDGESFIKDVGSLSLWNFSFFFINIFSFYLVTNILGPEEYGKYALVISLITTVSLAIFTSVNETLLRFAAITDDRRLVSNSIKYQYYFGFSALILLLIASIFLSDFYNKPLTLIIVFVSFSFLFTPYTESIKNFSIGKRRINNLIKISVFNQIFLVVFILALYLLNFRTAIFMGFAYLLVSFLTSIYTRHIFKLQKFKSDGKYNHKDIIKYIKGGFLFGIFKNITFQAALIMGARFVDTVHIAFYTFSIGLATASIFSVISALQTLTVPYVSKFYDNNDMNSVNKYFNASLKLGIIASIFISVALYFFLRLFLEYLFPKYAEVINIIPYILIAYIISNFNTPMSFLKSKGKIWILTKISIVASLFSLVNSYVLSKYFGFLGMLLSLIINISFISALSWYYSNKELKIRFTIFVTRKEFGAFKLYFRLAFSEIFKKFLR